MRWLIPLLMTAAACSHRDPQDRPSYADQAMPSKEFVTHTTPAVTSEESLAIINDMERDGWRVYDIQPAGADLPGRFVVVLRRPVKP